MTRAKWFTLTSLGILALLVGIPVAFAARSKPDEHHTLPSSGVGGPDIAVQRTLVLEDGVEFRSWIGLGAPLLNQSNHVVRPIAFSGSFLYQRVHLGEVHSLRAASASGREVIHFDLSGLDLGLADPTLSEESSRRAYQVDVTPKSGLSWEGVVDPRQDVVIAVTPIQ